MPAAIKGHRRQGGQRLGKALQNPSRSHLNLPMTRGALVGLRRVVRVTPVVSRHDAMRRRGQLGSGRIAPVTERGKRQHQREDPEGPRADHTTALPDALEGKGHDGYSGPAGLTETL